MSFNPDEYLKEDFDPSAYLSEGTGEPQEKTSTGMSALEHYGNAATLGYLPHIQALTEKALPDPSGGADEALRSQGFQVPKPASYVENRDENLKRLEQESKEHPYASAAGTGAGILASSLLPAGAVAKEASLGAKALAGAKSGALIGGLANPGDKEGEISPLQLGDRLKGAAIGGAIGAAAPVAIEGASKTISSVGDYLRNKAALKAARALGRPTPTQAVKMAASGQDAQIGRTLLDEGAIPALGTPKRIQGRIEGLKDKAGEEIGDLIDSAGSSKPIDSTKLGLDILDSPELAQMRKTPGMESTVAAIEKQVETLSKNGEMTLKEAQALRQGIDKSINFNKSAPEMRGAQEGLYQQRTAVRDAMNDAINNLDSGTPKDALLGANRKYGNLSKASDILDREIGRNQANRAVSLTDTIAGAAGLAGGGPIGAAALGAANKFGRTFGNSLQARMYDAISKGAAKSAPNLAKINPQVAQVIAQRTGAQARPSFEHEDNSITNDPKLMDLFIKNPDLAESIQDEKIREQVKKAINRKPAER